MRNRLVITAIILMLLLFFTACQSNSIDNAVEMSGEKPVVTPVEEKTPSPTPSPSPAPTPTPPPAGDSDALIASEIFVKYEKDLFIEADLTEQNKTMRTLMYITDDYFKAVMPDEECKPVAVFKTADDSAFIYQETDKMGADFTNLKAEDLLNYHNLIYQNSQYAENLERTEINGFDVVYGTMNYDGNDMEFWYSEEYDIPIKIDLVSAEGEVSMLDVFNVEEITTLDSNEFTKPSGVMFFNMGDSSDWDMKDLMAMFLGDLSVLY